METLSKFLKGREFIIRTDHKPLIGVLRNESFSSDRLSRLAVWLLDYTFTVKYVKGPENFTDCLSRTAVDDLYTYPEFKEGLDKIFVLSKGIWYEYVRPFVRRSVLLNAHTESHLAKTKMIEKLKELKVHWPHMVQEVEEFLQSCTCFLKKENRNKSGIKLKFSEEDKKGLLCMDTYVYDGVSFLTIMDVERDYVWILRLPDKTLDEVQKFI